MQNKNQGPAAIHAAENKVERPFAEGTVKESVKDEVLAKKRSETTLKNIEREVDGRHRVETQREVALGGKDESKHNGFKGPKLTTERYKPPRFREETIQKREDNGTYFQRGELRAPMHNSEENSFLEAVQIGTSFNRKRSESVDGQHKVDRQREDMMPARDLFNSLSQRRQDPLPVKNGTNFPSTVDTELAEDIQARSARKRSEDVKDELKSNFRSTAVPPPYVKPNKSKHKADMGSKYAHLSALDTDENETLTFNPPSNGRRPENPHTQFNVPDQQNGGILPGNEDGRGRFTEIYYKDDSAPRRRSHRKKLSRSKAGQDDKVNGEVGREEETVVRRISTTRRKHESRQGLQILFDDEHVKKDEDEKMIDKLLLHYSKKPSSSDPGKPRRNTKGETNDASKSPHHKTKDGTRVDDDSTPTTSRTMSLPPLQVTELEPKKIFARAASFQQDSPAKHVHPKLPDYDDLAARFAALRAKKG